MHQRHGMRRASRDTAIRRYGGVLSPRPDGRVELRPLVHRAVRSIRVLEHWDRMAVMDGVDRSPRFRMRMARHSRTHRHGRKNGQCNDHGDDAMPTHGECVWNRAQSYPDP